MNLHEYQAKELLKQFNLPLLKGKAYINQLNNIENDLNILQGPPWVVKSQIHAGGRGAGHFLNPFNNKYCTDHQRNFECSSRDLPLFSVRKKYFNQTLHSSSEDWIILHFRNTRSFPLTR